MTITVVTRWSIKQDDAQRIVRDAAPLMKTHGAESVRLGRVTTGENVGQTLVIVAYPNWETFGKAMTGQHEDQKYQEHYTAALQAGQLLDRSIIVADEL
jgi:hypothetical protein